MKKEKFYRKKSFIALLAFIGLIAVVIFLYATKETEIKYETVTAVRGELVQEVSITGRVEPAESVNLSFEISGKVQEVFAKVGDKVQVGQKLISLKSDELFAQLRQAQAGLSSAQARLDQYKGALSQEELMLQEMKKGTRPEEINIAEITYENAKKSLEEAEISLESIENKADADIKNVYNGALTSLPVAANYGKSALMALTDLQMSYLNDYSQDGITVAAAKEKAVYSLLGLSNAGRISSDQLSKINGGAYGLAQEAVTANLTEKTDQALSEMLMALYDVKTALESVVVKTTFTSLDKSELDSAKNSIDSQIVSLSAKQQLISVQKVANDNSISSAQSQVIYAQNSVDSAKSQLDLKKAGYTSDQIKAQESKINQANSNISSQKAMVSQAYANVQQYQAQLSKTILYAPISGLVTKMEAKVGEVVFPSSPYSDNLMTFVSIISDMNYQIETNVPEVDIAKIKIGDMATVTLDAYGDETEFTAKVISVEPAETIVEGIPAYKVKLEFEGQDERIKSGMTANIDILTEKKENIIIIPQRAVITKDGEKIVRIAVERPDEKVTDINEVTVETGMKGSDGRIEIVKGLNEGDKVVTFIQNGE